ncbi:DNA internalization-related competence protein ComEC/Rec2 [Caryophanon latum]|uniref:DNA internalization-related competence protein ComEC/Rec2 n=1 Tax=Caryophanon latum TaxID=33977 RepID=A0A1C0Z5G3_9BACL|nr:DNA internalization-related competence protein ComEC/Rec2 [Caryophanon latum]
MATLSAVIGVVGSYEHVAALCSYVLILCWLYYKKYPRVQYVVTCGVMLLFFAYSEYVQHTLTNEVAKQQVITWTDRHTIRGDTVRGFVKTAGGQKLYVTYEMKSEDEKAQLQAISLAGRTFVATGELVAPRTPNHMYSFQMIDYIRSHRAQGIYEITSWYEQSSKHSIATFLAKWRFQLNERIDRIFPESIAPEAKALLFGDQQETEEEAQRAYLALGITHLFAISGLHIALLAWLLYEAMIICRVRKEVAQSILLIALPVYGVLAGGAPSVWRAVSFVEIALIAQFFRKPLPLLTIIAASCLAYLCINPGTLFQVGFQLSYLASLALIMSARLLARYDNFWMQSFIVTVVCQLLTYPLLLYHFYTLSISSFFANVVFVPLFSFIILPINVILFVLPTQIGAPLMKLYEPMRVTLQQFIYWLGELPYQQWVSGQPPIWCCIVAYVCIVATFICFERRVHWSRVVPLLLMPVVLIEAVSILSVREPTVHFINVGQGDATLIEMPYRRHVMLIDTGGLLRFSEEEWKQGNVFEVGRDIVVPYMKGLGISKIDALVLTHADADHVEGAEEVLQELRVKRIHVPPNSVHDASMADVVGEVMKQRIPVEEKMAGDVWQHGDVSFTYMWPQNAQYEGNNSSLVLLMEANNHRVLLTGDVEEAGELDMLQAHDELLQNVTVLKAGHHGSKTSSHPSFVETVAPRLVVFTAGENNRYNHPHEDVVARFKASQSYMWQTGIDGTLKITLGDELRLQRH